MSTRASARATPMWMQPEGAAAVTVPDLLPKRYFIPKCPLARGPYVAATRWDPW